MNKYISLFNDPAFSHDTEKNALQVMQHSLAAPISAVPWPSRARAHARAARPEKVAKTLTAKIYAVAHFTAALRW